MSFYTGFPEIDAYILNESSQLALLTGSDTHGLNSLLLDIIRQNLRARRNIFCETVDHPIGTYTELLPDSQTYGLHLVIPSEVSGLETVVESVNEIYAVGDSFDLIVIATDKTNLTAERLTALTKLTREHHTSVLLAVTGEEPLAAHADLLAEIMPTVLHITGTPQHPDLFNLRVSTPLLTETGLLTLRDNSHVYGGLMLRVVDEAPGRWPYTIRALAEKMAEIARQQPAIKDPYRIQLLVEREFHFTHQGRLRAARDLANQHGWLPPEIKHLPVKDNEQIKRDLSDHIIDIAYSISEAPWDRDYEDGRAIADFLIRWVMWQRTPDQQAKRALTLDRDKFINSAPVQNLRLASHLPELADLVYTWRYGQEPAKTTW